MYREALNEWMAGKIEEHLENGTPVHLPSLTDAWQEHVRSTPELLEAVFEAVRPDAYEVGKRMIGKTHDRNSREERPLVIAEGSAAISQADLAWRAAKFLTRFDTWLEHDGVNYVKLTDMSRKQLLNAAKTRARRGGVEIHTASFLYRLAEHMNDADKVKEVFESAELEAVWSEAQEQTDGKLRELLP